MMPPERSKNPFSALIRPEWSKKQVNSLSSDVYTGWSVEQERDEFNRRSSAAFTKLKRIQIPNFAKFLTDKQNEANITSDNLVREAHRFGINVRHLGRVRQYTSPNSKASKLLLLEMISRCLKNILNEGLREFAAQGSREEVEHEMLQWCREFISNHLCGPDSPFYLRLFYSPLLADTLCFDLSKTISYSQVNAIVPLKGPTYTLVANDCYFFPSNFAKYFEIQILSGKGFAFGLSFGQPRVLRDGDNTISIMVDLNGYVRGRVGIHTFTQTIPDFHLQDNDFVGLLVYGNLYNNHLMLNGRRVGSIYIPFDLFDLCARPTFEISLVDNTDTEVKINFGYSDLAYSLQDVTCFEKVTPWSETIKQKLNETYSRPCEAKVKFWCETIKPKLNYSYSKALYDFEKNAIYDLRHSIPNFQKLVKKWTQVASLAMEGIEEIDKNNWGLPISQKLVGFIPRNFKCRNNGIGQRCSNSL
eukprot:TRINITY_DN1516_c0_g1_i12.p1 TRINITY_DN1516_c0_g1~~TRINITY_DN1516_c0_g1_i12.p1  ORF type:complete len:473 (+),score=67.82 TRINITY_DN1516_c0_g1_i12:1047-2465(+)